MKKIVITGGNGILARYASNQFENGNKIFQLNKNQVDIRNYKQTTDTFFEIKPDVVLHLAALTNVDYCQKNPDDAFAVNAEGTKNIASACKKNGASLIYISTASVFNGKKDVFFEDDIPDPVHVYGESKLKGEQYIKDILSDFIILRIGWLIGGHSGGKKFISSYMF